MGYDPAMLMRENAEMVAAALGRLQPDLQEVVELRVFAGLTFQQISQVTGPPQGTAVQRGIARRCENASLVCEATAMNDYVEEGLQPIDAPLAAAGASREGARSGGR